AGRPGPCVASGVTPPAVLARWDAMFTHPRPLIGFPGRRRFAASSTRRPIQGSCEVCGTTATTSRLRFHGLVYTRGMSLKNTADLDTGSPSWLRLRHHPPGLREERPAAPVAEAPLIDL